MTRGAHWAAETMAPTEASVEHDILRYLELCRYWTLQTHSGKRRPMKQGTLDIVFGKGPVWGCIETKGEDGILSDAQIEEIECIQRAKGIVIVARSLDDVISVLKGKGL